MFIVFEGLDGAGKTTQVQLLAEALRARGCTVVAVREPGGTEAGEAIRGIMFGDHAAPLRPLTWAFLMNGARAQLVEDVILPALSEGSVVIADRYWYSTMAYQAGGDGVDERIVLQLSRTATKGLEPDCVVYIDVPPDVAIRRKLSGRRDVLDSRPLEFHVRVAHAYRQMLEADHGRWHVVDGKKAADELARDVLAAILPSISANATASVP